MWLLINTGEIDGSEAFRPLSRHILYVFFGDKIIIFQLSVNLPWWCHLPVDALTPVLRVDTSL